MIARSSRSFETHRERLPRGGRLWRALRGLLLLFVAYLVLHAVLLNTVSIDTAAMSPTLEAGDRVMASPLLYGPKIRLFGWALPGFSAPARGDLVSLRPAFMPEVPFGRRLANPIVRFFSLERARLDEGDGWRSAVQVKRVIGLPGDTIRMERFVAYVRPAGEDRFLSEFELSASEYQPVTEGLPEGWLGDDPFGHSMQELTLGPEEYFVLGDERLRAIDSRHWGPISAGAMHARVIFRYWPLRRMGAP